jgi:hypothetical protein
MSSTKGTRKSSTVLQSVVGFAASFILLVANTQSVSLSAQVNILPGTDLNESDLEFDLGSLFGGLGGNSNDDDDQDTDPAASDPFGIITPVNETTNTTPEMNIVLLSKFL